jgi:hypothetical protein
VNRRRTARLLRDIDAPRAPRPEFDRALRTDLFGTNAAAVPEADDEPVVEPVAPDVVVPIRRPNRRSRWLAAAAVVALAVGIVTVVELQSGDDRVDVSSRPPASVVADIRTACARFNASAFGNVGRAGLIGDGNEDLLADVARARELLTGLRAALASFAAELQAAGVDNDALFSSLDVARADAALALRDLDQGSSNQAAEDARQVESELIQIERALGDVGVVGCL